VVSPSANAAFYVAFMLASFLYIVPQSLSTVLFAIASATPELIGEKLRFVLRMSLAIGIPVCLVLAASAHLALSVFGAGYAAQATFPLWLLILGYIPGIPNAVYIAVCRATGRVAQAAVFLAVFAAIQLAAIAIGGKLGGLHGLSYGMLGVAVVEALITTPPVLRAAYRRVTIRSTEPSGATAARPAVAAARRRDHVRDQEIRLRQEAGLAALIAIATAVEQPQWTADRGRHRRALGATAPDGMAALVAMATHGARV
jgi:hypothetical protein